MPVRYLHRPHAVGAWMAHPVARAPPAEEPDQAPPPHPLLQADTEEPTEAQVAAEDPLCGLLQMQARASRPCCAGWPSYMSSLLIAE